MRQNELVVREQHVYVLTVFSILMVVNCGIDRLVRGSWWVRWRFNLLVTLFSAVLGQFVVWLTTH